MAMNYLLGSILKFDQVGRPRVYLLQNKHNHLSRFKAQQATHSDRIVESDLVACEAWDGNVLAPCGGVA